MTRRPLAPDLWEQALINGRVVHPSSDEQATAYASEWYQKQGGLFAPVLEASMAFQEPIAQPEEPAQVEGPVLEEPKPLNRRQRRSSQEKEQPRAGQPAAEEEETQADV